VAGEVENRQVVILPFDARYPNTDMVLQPAWPILIAELSAWFSPPHITDTTQSLTPGTPVTIRFIENADEAVVTRPTGQRSVMRAEGSTAIFADTSQPGLYRVDLRQGGETIKSEQFAVNLFDPNESRIAPQNSLAVGATTVSRNVREETARRELWPWVAGIGLAILAVEWWAYHRSLQRIPRAALAGRHGRPNKPGGGRTFRRWNRRKPRRVVQTR